MAKNYNEMTDIDWVNRLSKKLDLDAYNEEILLHDIHNLRGEEWLETIKDSNKVSKADYNAFKTFLNKQTA